MTGSQRGCKAPIDVTYWQMTRTCNDLSDDSDLKLNGFIYVGFSGMFAFTWAVLRALPSRACFKKSIAAFI